MKRDILLLTYKRDYLCERADQTDIKALYTLDINIHKQAIKL